MVGKTISELPAGSVSTLPNMHDATESGSNSTPYIERKPAANSLSVMYVSSSSVLKLVHISSGVGPSWGGGGVGWRGVSGGRWGWKVVVAAAVVVGTP